MDGMRIMTHLKIVLINIVREAKATQLLKHFVWIMS